MKQLIIVSLLMITLVSCKKQTISPNKISNSTSNTSLGAFSGTFVNSANVSDQFTLTQCSNSNSGGIRYVISNHYNYNTYSTNRFNMPLMDIIG